MPCKKIFYNIIFNFKNILFKEIVRICPDFGDAPCIGRMYIERFTLIFRTMLMQIK